MPPIPIPIAIVVVAAGARWAIERHADATDARAELQCERRRGEADREARQASAAERAAERVRASYSDANFEAELRALRQAYEATDRLAELADDEDRANDVLAFAKARRTHIQAALGGQP